MLFAGDYFRDCPHRTGTSQISESQDWAKGDPQVVVRTLIEVNQVAKLQPQSERPQSCRRTTTRIKCRVQIGVTDAEDRLTTLLYGIRLGLSRKSMNPPFSVTNGRR